jgi:hypothetical protein
LVIVLAIFSSVVESVVSQSELEPLGNREAQDQGGEPACALAKNAPEAQQADMVALGAGKFQHVAHLANQGAKEQFGQHRELEQDGGVTVELAQSQMAFPGFENDFNAPTQPVDGD